MSRVGQMLTEMRMAYQRVADERIENVALYEAVQGKWVGRIRSDLDSRGYEAAHMTYDNLYNRIALSYPSARPGEHLDLMRALMTDYTQRFLDHITYRLQNGGNVAIEFTGPTGMGKSSCAIALADWISPIVADELLDHLVFDFGDLTSRLAGKKPGQTVLVDEYVSQSGDGARTVKDVMSNVEDTIRASRVNLFWCSPTKHDHSTSQCALELVLWAPKQKRSLFLVWIDGKVLGTVELPWAPDHLWKVYGGWKSGNVTRSLEGRFRDNHMMGRMIVRLFGNDDFTQFLLALNKPKKGNFDEAVELFNTQALATRQKDKLVSLMYTVCYAFDRLEPKFERMFGVAANDGLREVAKLCYSEG